MDKSVYKRQFEENRNHWWFESRKNIINHFLLKNLNNKKIKILDYGCGVGVNVEMLSKFGQLSIYDNNINALKFIKKNYKKKKFKILNNLNSKTKYDLILALDVIEHIENDKKIIKFLHKKIKKNGKILITVPAYNYLFTSKDKVLHHKRRYTKKTLSKILLNHFKTLKFSYFNFILFPVIAPLLIFYKVFNVQFIDKVEKKGNSTINKILKNIFSFEKFLISFLNLPFGISIFYFGEKK